MSDSGWPSRNKHRQSRCFVSMATALWRLYPTRQGAVVAAMRSVCLAVILSSISCVTADRVVVRGPDGPATLVMCSAYEACLEEAAEGCPFGYEIIDRNAQTSVAGFS